MRERVAISVSLTCLALLVAVAPARAEDSCIRAKALYEQHQYVEAEQEYKKPLAVAKCKGAALAAQAHEQAVAAEVQTEVSLQQALRLQAAGFEPEARKQVKEVVEKSSTPIPSQLSASDRQPDWWLEFLGFGRPWARTVLEMLIVAAAVVLVLLLLFTGINALGLRFARSARLEGFSASSDATLGPLLNTALGAVLASMRDESPIPTLSLQSGTEPKFEIPPAVNEAVPQAALLSGLVQMIDKLLYRRLFIISGTVHPPHEHRGAGITIVVANRSGRKSEQMTVWEEEFMLKEAGVKAKEAVRYERLILPVAVWLAYRPMLGFKPELEAPLGARHWRSYALFALGELVPDQVKERRLYEQALDLDPDNIGARLNLATLLMRRPSGQVVSGGEAAQIADGSSEGWLERLSEAGVHLKLVAKSPAATDQPIWYRGHYMETIRCMYLGEASAAADALRQLLEAMRLNVHLQRLSPLIHALERPAGVLNCSIEVIKIGRPQDLSWISLGWLSENGEYNLACFWARYALRLTGDERAAARVKAVRALRRAVARNEDLAAEARVDPAFDEGIREDQAFKDVVKVNPPAKEEAEPLRYAITLDPGPQLLRLARRG